jgi:hypothetical protein
MFEKSIHAMNNVDPTDNNQEDNLTKSSPNEISSSSSTSRNGFSRKSNGSVSSKGQSTKPTCTVS